MLERLLLAATTTISLYLLLHLEGNKLMPDLFGKMSQNVSANSFSFVILKSEQQTFNDGGM
jgi:hypothetical protein